MINPTSEEPRPPDTGAGPQSGEEPPSAEAAELEPLLWSGVEAAEPEALLWSGVEEAPPLEVGGPYPPPSTPEALPRPSRGQRARRLARELIETFVLALLIFLVVRAALQNFRVEGSSMDPVLHDGQYLIVNKAIYTRINLDTISKFLPFVDPGNDPIRYLFRRPQRGDVVVFRFPGNPDRDFIKRIIGEPGDTVEVREGIVYINGGALDEPYITSKPTYTYGPSEVPPKQYFALGDNRNNSYDSHVWGFLPEENIIGQAWLSYWPKDDWGLVANKDLSPLAAGESP
jgi:signal peptidase I